MAYVSGDLCREIDIDIQIGDRNTFHHCYKPTTQDPGLSLGYWTATVCMILMSACVDRGHNLRIAGSLKAVTLLICYRSKRI